MAASAPTAAAYVRMYTLLRVLSAVLACWVVYSAFVHFTAEYRNHTDDTVLINMYPSVSPIPKRYPKEKGIATSDRNPRYSPLTAKYRIMNDFDEISATGQILVPGTTKHIMAWQSAAEQNGFSMFLTEIRDRNLATPEQDYVSRVSHRRRGPLQVCRAEFVCFNATNTLVVSKTRETAENISSLSKECCVPGKWDSWPAEKCSETDLTSWRFCRCFPARRFHPAFIDLQQAMEYPLLPNMTWFSNHWVSRGYHHPDHFAMKVVEYHSYHTPGMSAFQLPHAENLLIHDYTTPFTSWEELLLNISLSRNPNTVNLYPGSVFKDTEFLSDGGICAQNVAWIPTYGHPFSYEPDRTAPYWQQTLDDYFQGAQQQSGRDRGSADCPPSRAVVLHRVEGKTLRRIRNLGAVKRLFHKLGITIVDDVTVSSHVSGEDQARVFRSFGLMISSHSSQLSNLLYARRNAAVIELNTVMYHNVFAGTARPMQVWYNISAGHEPADEKLQDMFRKHCNPFLPAQYQYKQKSKRHPEYPECDASKLIVDDYYVNLAYLEASLKRALRHLDTVCGGHWFDEKLALTNRAGLMSPAELL